MDYDQNTNYTDSQQDEQDDMWLEDLKALLDDSPRPNVGRDPAPSSVTGRRDSAVQDSWELPPVSFPQAMPRQNWQQPQTGSAWNQPAARSDSHQIPMWQGNPYPDFTQAQDEEIPGKKKHLGAIITLSIVIIIELAGIAGVAYTWLQWLR